MCCFCVVFRSGSVWLKVTPFGFRRLLNYIKDTYDNIPLMVTENGVTDNNGTELDDHRVSYYYKYMNELLKGELKDDAEMVKVWFHEKY